MLLKSNKRAKLASNRLRNTCDVNLLLATWAVHEGKSNSERGPFVLEKLYDAICVKDMTAGKLGTSFSSELTSVADCTQLVLINTLEKTSGLSAVNI